MEFYPEIKENNQMLNIVVPIVATEWQIYASVD